jgi:hypothetical protein
MLHSYRYTLLPPSNEDPEAERNKALVEIMANLMYATGVYHLFNHEDYKDFLKRFHLITRSCNFINTYFLEKQPSLYVIYKGGILEIGIPDLQKVIGLICGTSPRKNIPIDQWKKDIQRYVNDSMIYALHQGFVFFIGEIEVGEPNNNGTNSSFIKFKNGIRPITDEDMQNADILSASILKDFDENLFRTWFDFFPNVIERYRSQAEQYSIYEHFTFLNISSEKFQKIDKHFRSLINSNDYDLMFVRELTHLAWAYKNEYVYEDENEGKLTDEFVWLDLFLLGKFEPGSDLDTIAEKYKLTAIYDFI